VALDEGEKDNSKGFEKTYRPASKLSGQDMGGVRNHEQEKERSSARRTLFTAGIG